MSEHTGPETRHHEEDHRPEQGTPGHTAHQHTGHNHEHKKQGHAGHDPDVFRTRFWITLLLTVPVLIYSHHIQDWFHFRPPHFPGAEYLPAVLGTVIFFYGGTVFLQSGLAELRDRRPGMMTLISLAISVAFVYSAAVTLGLPGEELYWELATLVVIMLLGHWLEMGAVQGARGALRELAALLPDRAWRISEEETAEVPVSELRPGDLVLVRPGERIPADGVVAEGESFVNEAMLTGESRPLRKSKDDPVTAGTVNEDGSLRVRVEQTEGDTALAGIMRLVEQAQSSTSRTQALADRAAFWLVAVALGAATVTTAGWIAAGAGSVFVLERVVTVLIIACPHALGLAIPLVIAISTTLSARNGLLVKDRLALEKARLLDCVVFDKTGTLTRGEQGLTGAYPAPGLEREELLRLAATAEADSEHAIGRAILSAARKENIDIPSVQSFEALPGRGVRARLQGEDIYVGGPNLLEHLGLEPGPELASAAQEGTEAGHGLVYLVAGGEVKGLLTLSDMVREESYEAVAALKRKGIKVVLLTGDSEAVASRVATELEIDRYFAGVLPGSKAGMVEELKQEGYITAMVGDGVNDAPALAAADIGVAIGAGTDVAVESAGIVLMKNDPRDVARLIELSRAVYRKMIQNLAWATGYNLLAIPLAAGVLAPVGFVLPMAVGAVVMSASTIIVALNAQLLRRAPIFASPPGELPRKAGKAEAG